MMRACCENANAVQENIVVVHFSENPNLDSCKAVVAMRGANVFIFSGILSTVWNFNLKNSVSPF